MSCYLRHLDDIFLAAGIRLTKADRPRIHAIIQEITQRQTCPEVWRSLKARLPREDTWDQLVFQLRTRWREVT